MLEVCTLSFPSDTQMLSAVSLCCGNACFPRRSWEAPEDKDPLQQAMERGSGALDFLNTPLVLDYVLLKFSTSLPNWMSRNPFRYYKYISEDFYMYETGDKQQKLNQWSLISTPLLRWRCREETVKAIEQVVNTNSLCIYLDSGVLLDSFGYEAEVVSQVYGRSPNTGVPQALVVFGCLSGSRCHFSARDLFDDL